MSCIAIKYFFNIKCMNSLMLVKPFTPVRNYAAKTTASTTAGGVMGLGKGKKKVSKLAAVEKKELPVESDPNKLVSSVCGSNIYTTGDDVQLKSDSEYPEWLWSIRTGKAPTLDELDPNTKEYWLKVRTMGIKRQNKLNKLKKFH